MVSLSSALCTEQLGLFLCSQVPWQRQQYISPLFCGFLPYILQGCYLKIVLERKAGKRGHLQLQLSRW